MKFLCECGEVIRDQTDFLPYKAYIVPDQEAFGFLDKLETLLDELLSAENAKEDQHGYARIHLMSARKKLHETVDGLWVRAFRKIYQCPTCGRLNLDSLDGRQGFSFAPEDKDTPRDLLRGALDT